MAQKVQWTPIDDIAVDHLSAIIRQEGLSYRRLADEMDMSVSFARLRTIMAKQKGPLRLSEFVYLCMALDVDPADELQEIVDEARERQSEDSDEPEHIIGSRRYGVAGGAVREGFTVAAMTDPNKKIESETPDD